ncbi:unannotated protein [freshwater metagenome]|uniref:Unannotated protein n=1 Tax=freshwater metagenome TaxID=449393 RepID=A0A6J6SV40_9ZZZZ
MRWVPKTRSISRFYPPRVSFATDQWPNSSLQEELPLPPSSPLVRAGSSDEMSLSILAVFFFADAVTPKRLT